MTTSHALEYKYNAEADVNKIQEHEKQKENLYVNQHEIDLIDQQQLQIYTDYFNSKKD